MDHATLTRLVTEHDQQLREMRTQRPAVVTRDVQVRPAVTAEWYSGGSYSYPSQAGCTMLPVVLQQHAVSGTSATFSDKSAEPKVYAVSPIGWLPPGVSVDVAYDGVNYRIVRAPSVLHGVAASAVSAGSLEPTTPYFGASWGTVQVWSKVGAYYVPQEYDDGSDVNLTVVNNSLFPITADKFLTFHRNASNEWTVGSPVGGIDLYASQWIDPLTGSSVTRMQSPAVGYPDETSLRLAQIGSSEFLSAVAPATPDWHSVEIDEPGTYGLWFTWSGHVAAFSPIAEGTCMFRAVPQYKTPGGSWTGWTNNGYDCGRPLWSLYKYTLTAYPTLMSYSHGNTGATIHRILDLDAGSKLRFIYQVDSVQPSGNSALVYVGTSIPQRCDARLSVVKLR